LAVSAAVEEDSAALAVAGSAAAARAEVGEGKNVTGDASRFRKEGTMRRMFGFALLAMALSGCGYNQMVNMKEAIDSAWAQVQNQLQRRNDLIPNLVEVTKGYAAHEKEIFESVANARARLIGAGTREGQIEASNELSGALGRLLAIAEQYPQLKANEQFARLSDELAGTENRIAVERKRYNDAVQVYNTYIRQIPRNLYAGLFGFSPQEYFPVPESAQQVPKVDFGSGQR
jgi:LemA protein